MTATEAKAARIAGVDELDANLARHPDLNHVQLVLTDVNGVARGRNLDSVRRLVDIIEFGSAGLHYRIKSSRSRSL